MNLHIREVFLPACLLIFAIFAEGADQPPKATTIPAETLDTPVDSKLSSSPCGEPATKRPSALGGLFRRNYKYADDPPIQIGDIDMRTNDCLPPQVEETVPNGQKVVLTLDTNPTDECSGVPTSKSDPKPDYGALFAAALPKYFGLDESPKTRGPHQKITLPQVSDGTLTVAISCRLPADSESVVRMPRSVVVHYKNAPLFSGSAGVLISTMGTKTYGNSTAQASVTNGVVTTRNSVALTANSNVQFVPIAFLNTYLMGSNRLHIDLQSGAGINPNGSKTKVEYFLGSALAWHGAYIAPGVHIAQAQYLTNGFSLDETIASNVTVPTAYRTTFRFGIAISYSPSVASSPSK